MHWQVAGKASLPASENNIYLLVPKPKIIVDRTAVSSAGPHGVSAAQQRMGAEPPGIVGIALRVVTLVVHGSAVHGGMAGAAADEASTSNSAFDGNTGQCGRTLLAAAAASTADPALLRAYCRHLREILLQSDACSSSIGGDRSSVLLDTLEVALALRRLGTDSAAERNAPTGPAPAAAPIHLPIQGMRTVNGGSCMHASCLCSHWRDS